MSSLHPAVTSITDNAVGETDLDGDIVTVDIVFFEAESEDSITVQLPVDKGTTVNDLRNLVAIKGQLDKTTADTLEFCELTTRGKDNPLTSSSNPYDCVCRGSRLVMITTEIQFVIVFLPDGQFVLIKCSWDSTANEICQHSALKAALISIDNPALYLLKPEDGCESSKARMLSTSDKPLQLLYHRTAGARIRRQGEGSVRLVLGAAQSDIDSKIPSATISHEEVPRRVKSGVSKKISFSNETPRFSQTEIAMEGELWKRGEDALRKWRKKWVSLDETRLCLWDDKSSFDANNPPLQVIESTQVVSVDYLGSGTDKRRAKSNFRLSAIMDGPRLIGQGVAGLISMAKNDKEFAFVVRTSIPNRPAFTLASDGHGSTLKWVSAIKAMAVPVSFDGWLEKKGDRAGTGWKFRWFELRGSSLLYFEGEGQPHRGRIELSHDTSISRVTGEKKTFKITLPMLCQKRSVGKSFKKLVSTGKREYFFKARTVSDMDRWVTQLTKNKASAPMLGADIKREPSQKRGFHKRGIYSSIPTAALDALDSGEATAALHGNLVINKAAGMPQIQVVDHESNTTTTLPQDCVEYIMLEPDSESEDEDNLECTIVENGIDDPGHHIHFRDCGLGVDVLQQLVEFLKHQERIEEANIHKAYADRTARIKKKIKIKLAEAALGPPEFHVKYGMYFHGNISRAESERRLSQHGDERGTYLIREKEEASKYVLSTTLSGTEYIHYLFERQHENDNFRFDNVELPYGGCIFSILEVLLKPPGERSAGLRHCGPQLTRGLNVPI